MNNDPRDILLVEDNPSDVALTLRALQKARISNRMVVARDGVEALECLFATGAHEGRNPAEQPALILLDLKLPRLSGLEVLARVRNDPRTRRLPVVILTTSDDQQDLAQAYDGGANSYIRKPVDFGSFVTAIEQMGLYWLVINQGPPAP